MKGVISFCNSVVYNIGGYPEGEFTGKHFSKIASVRVKDIPAFIRVFNSIVKGKIPEPFEAIYQRKDGTTGWTELHVGLLKVGRKRRILVMQHDINERKQAEERLKHFDLVFRAIRNVNRLITKDKDRGELLEGACENLTGTRGYYNAWIALLGESGNLIEYAESGLGKDFQSMVERLKQGRLPACGQRALKQSGVRVTNAPVSDCADCPLSGGYAGRGGMTVRLEHGGRVYGLLSVSVPVELAYDAEELGLFHEVAGDIAFTLHDIEMEEQRKQELSRILTGNS